MRDCIEDHPNKFQNHTAYQNLTTNNSKFWYLKSIRIFNIPVRYNWIKSI